MTAHDLQRAKLEQACPDCGRWEAAGSYCSGCLRPMGPDDWYRNGDEDRRAVARQQAAGKATTPPKRPRGTQGAEVPAAPPTVRRMGVRPLPEITELELRFLFGDR